MTEHSDLHVWRHPCFTFDIRTISYMGPYKDRLEELTFRSESVRHSNSSMMRMEKKCTAVINYLLKDGYFSCFRLYDILFIPHIAQSPSLTGVPLVRKIPT